MLELYNNCATTTYAHGVVASFTDSSYPNGTPHLDPPFPPGTDVLRCLLGRKEENSSLKAKILVETGAAADLCL